jgi:hypothetical protein
MSTPNEPTSSSTSLPAYLPPLSWLPILMLLIILLSNYLQNTRRAPQYLQILRKSRFYSTESCAMFPVAVTAPCGKTLVYGNTGNPWMAMVYIRQSSCSLFNTSFPYPLLPFRLQLRILQRAMQMLSKGGRIVYSTCSFNPVENEAVIAAALNSVAGNTFVWN